jgi:putative thiamine transport system permease protein
MPLLLPQTGFLFGMQVLIIWLEVDGLYITVIWAHYLFVFPYTLLTLGPIWRRFNVRYELLGASFGFSKFKRLWRIKMPLMAVPVITSFAIGFAVSSALYLPTIFAGNGTFRTLTTEAVTLAANASRQAAGIAALLQMILPLVIFIIAGIYIRFRLHNFSYFRISH